MPELAAGWTFIALTVTVPEFFSITTRSCGGFDSSANAELTFRDVAGVTGGTVPSTAFAVAGCTA
jgi:hypothetical protein